MTTPRGPSRWINKYVEGYKAKKMNIEEILETENAIRALGGARLLKAKSVKRMLNQAGLSTSKAKMKESKQAEIKEPVAKVKPCVSCEYYRNDMCVYPQDLFEHYETLNAFYQDLSRNWCELKKLKEAT